MSLLAKEDFDFLRIAEKLDERVEEQSRSLAIQQ